MQCPPGQVTYGDGSARVKKRELYRHADKLCKENPISEGFGGFKGETARMERGCRLKEAALEFAMAGELFTPKMVQSSIEKCSDFILEACDYPLTKFEAMSLQRLFVVVQLPFVATMMRPTFFAHFCAGEDQVHRHHLPSVSASPTDLYRHRRRHLHRAGIDVPVPQNILDFQPGVSTGFIKY